MTLYQISFHEPAALTQPVEREREKGEEGGREGGREEGRYNSSITQDILVYLELLSV